MKFVLICFISAFCLLSCQQQKQVEDYASETLEILKVSSNVYQHISYLQTESFGNVPCNGMIVFKDNEAIIFDTPATDASSEELIKWVEGSLECKVKAVISTHFHKDCVGGLNVFHRKNIPSYANFKTIEAARLAQFALPQNGFDNKMELHLGKSNITAEFVGEGHTKDNVIGYFPEDKVLFGGCLIKEFNAGKGNLEDANEAEWSTTVRSIKQKYADAQIVIPGHGKIGGQELLDYTIGLFDVK